MTDDKKPRHLEPETAVRRIRRRAETESDRLDLAMAEARARFSRAEMAWRQKTIECVPASLRDPARAMLTAIGIEVLPLALTESPGVADASPESRPDRIIDAEFRDPAVDGDDEEPAGPTVYELIDAELEKREVVVTASDAPSDVSLPPSAAHRPAWLDVPPPPVTAPIVVDRSAAKDRA